MEGRPEGAVGALGDFGCAEDEMWCRCFEREEVGRRTRRSWEGTVKKPYLEINIVI